MPADVGSTVVFLGPSLPRAQAAALLDAEYLPPARCGDVYRLLPRGVQRIILLDGMFHGTPSVWQRELLEALDEGIEVYGGASMGALRAAELHPYGMRGCGTIFAWYRDGVIDGDDEVALLHGGADADYRALSEPLVNVRSTLHAAVRDGALERERAAEIVRHAKALPYPSRTWRNLLLGGPPAAWSPGARERLAQYVGARRVDRKALDAALTLRSCAASSLASRPPAASAAERTSVWQPWRFLLAGFERPGGTALGIDVLALAARDAPRFREVCARLRANAFLVDWARRAGVSCPPAELDGYQVAWRRSIGGGDGAWLSRNGLTDAALHRLLAVRALTSWLLRAGPHRFGLPSHRERGVTAAPGHAGDGEDVSDGAVSFLVDWAARAGVRCPAGAELVAWMIERGPDFFGLPWREDLELLNELQVTGAAAHLLAGAAA